LNEANERFDKTIQYNCFEKESFSIGNAEIHDSLFGKAKTESKYTRSHGYQYFEAKGRTRAKAIIDNLKDSAANSWKEWPSKPTGIDDLFNDSITKEMYQSFSA